MKLLRPRWSSCAASSALPSFFRRRSGDSSSTASCSRPPKRPCDSSRVAMRARRTSTSRFKKDSIGRWVDFTGLDIFYGAMKDRQRQGEGGDAPEVLRKLVEAGHLGRKSGQGFFEYPK